MKTASTLAVALISAVVLCAGAAQADTPSPTRAQVIAELARARASGELDRLNSENGSVFLRNTPSTRTRAEVVAELSAARDGGELALLHSEDPAPPLRVAQAARKQPLVVATAK